MMPGLKTAPEIVKSRHDIFYLRNFRLLFKITKFVIRFENSHTQLASHLSYLLISIYIKQIKPYGTKNKTMRIEKQQSK